MLHVKIGCEMHFIFFPRFIAKENVCRVVDENIGPDWQQNVDGQEGEEDPGAKEDQMVRSTTIGWGGRPEGEEDGQRVRRTTKRVRNMTSRMKRMTRKVRRTSRKVRRTRRVRKTRSWGGQPGERGGQPQKWGKQPGRWGGPGRWGWPGGWGRPGDWLYFTEYSILITELFWVNQGVLLNRPGYFGKSIMSVD